MTLAPTILTHMAGASAASEVMRSYVTPIIRTMGVFASLVCVFFLVNGGIQYITSAGRPDNLEHAKHIIRSAIIGLVIVLGATLLVSILTHAYASSGSTATTQLPQLTSIQPEPVSNGLVSVLIKAITGLLNNIIQSIAKPFLAALSFFTSGTPLMADNSSVFTLWLAMVSIADVLLILVVALLGFHVMSAPTFGFDEIEFKHLLPRIAIVFLLLNVSIFVIDGVIELSNALIRAIDAAGNNVSVWGVLTDIVKNTGGQGVAALLIMVAFLILSVILLVYYVGRLVTLFIGAVLSPLILLLWLLPGFRDFSETAAKTYLVTIFVLFVHVIILQLAASLFAGMTLSSPTHTPNTLMAMVVGLATLVALLKTQGLMQQFAYVSTGARSARRLGGQFMNGVSYITSKSAVVTGATSSRAAGKSASSAPRPSSSTTVIQSSAASKPKSPTKKAKTGTTTVAPSVRPKADGAKTPEPFDPTKPTNKRKVKS